MSHSVKSFSIAIMAICGIFAWGLALADVPSVMSYDGFLRDGEGVAVTDTLDLSFAIYSTDVGGTSLWAEKQTKVAVQEGVFHVFLGSVVPLDESLFPGAPRWLETTVGGTVLMPRRFLGTVPSAFRAAIADSLVGGAIVADGKTKSLTAENVTVSNDLTVKNDFFLGGPSQPSEFELQDPLGNVLTRLYADEYYDRYKGRMEFYDYDGSGAVLTAISDGVVHLYDDSGTLRVRLSNASLPVPHNYSAYFSLGVLIDDGNLIVGDPSGRRCEIGSNGSIRVYDSEPELLFEMHEHGRLSIHCPVQISDDLTVFGYVYKGGGGFRIDHPLFPDEKYLQHSFVESPDMMNVYNGIVTLDRNGEAWVELPEWFEALNRDFRYQLTCIGGFAPVYIANEVTNNRFKIAGGGEGMRVSWQATGIRQDKYAREHPIPVELDK